MKNDCNAFRKDCVKNSANDAVVKYKAKIRDMITSDPGYVDMMVDIIFPTVSGCYDAKFGALCLLASPTDSGRVRRRTHVLYHGMPGTGKSELSNVITGEFGGLKLSCDPKTSALKGDGRRTDGGVKLLNMYSGKPVVIHDIELTKEIDSIRDVMEDGMYTSTIGGTHTEYEAQCAILGSSNNISKISEAIRSRFDLAYKFDMPSAEQSMDIVDDILNSKLDCDFGVEFKRLYVKMVQDYENNWYQGRDEIKQLYKDFFDANGGRTGRYIQSVDRIARSIAKIHFSDIKPEYVERALELKLQSEAVLNQTK